MDLTLLLQPISGSAPCGDDMSFSSEFDTVAELRREDDPTLPQGDFVTELKVADWRGVATLCEELMAKRSKDLRIAGWLMESWTHLNGFGGLADGLGLLDELCKRYWQEVHPQADDGELELRVGNLSWAISHVEALAQHAPLLKSPLKALGSLDLEAARTRGAAAKTGESTSAGSGDDGPLMPDDVARIQRETPKAFFAENLAQASRALDALSDLQATLDPLLGDDSPGFVAARKVLESALHTAKRYAKESGAITDASVPDEVSASEEARHVIARAGAVHDGPLHSRAQALRQLRDVAEFFRRTEPHSPVAYLADKAANWGEMTLHDWLRAVMKSGTTLEQIEELLGVPPRQAE
ncbi:type VI secretion system protein TssA [Piscinibacter terrae]|uniref:type VI secretion system protein TssA n=1 Tax=Piscinibacter terrae TaxID=2496871 RepID=UPI0013871EBB|nr:type VI secretion system protein TssA [Albitalea terrae]